APRPAPRPAAEAALVAAVDKAATSGAEAPAEEEALEDAAFIAPRAAKPGDPIAEEPAPRPVPRVAAHDGDPTPFTVEGMRREARKDAAKPADGGRFGLNSLIHRMTGGGRPGAEQPAGPAAAPSPGPRLARDERHEDMAEDDEDLRMEIPAFLRRQAN
ncbi:MAG: hypothetical protein AAF322_07195, partial [Pseudomonadota bacterium]